MEIPQDPATAEDDARRLVQTHGPRLFALALRLCDDPTEAEELVFRTLERALAALGRYRPEAPFEAWLRTILLNLRRNDLRARAARPPSASALPDLAADPVAVPDPGPSPAELTAARADAEAARRAVARLPDRLRAPVVLHYFEGLDVAETARELRVPAGTHAVELSRPGYRSVTQSVEVGRDRTAALGTVGLERLFIPDVAVTTRNGTVVRGMFRERAGGFYRVETAPGLVHSIPLADIESVAPIRSDAEPETEP